MKIATFNILNPYHAVKWKTKEGFVERAPEEIATLRAQNPRLITKDNRVDNWSTRQHIICKNLQSSQFSVVCLQEVNSQTYHCLQMNLEPQGIRFLPLSTGISKPEDSEEQKMGTTIAYDAAKVDLIRCKVFNAPYSEQFARGSILADFKDKASGRVFRVVSIHLKGYDPNMYSPEVEREKNNKKQIEKQAGFYELIDIVREAESNTAGIDEIVLAGDFNDDRAAEYSQSLSRHKYLEDVGYTSDGDLSATELATGRKIDWIYHKTLKGTPALPKPFQFCYDPTASDHRIITTQF